MILKWKEIDVCRNLKVADNFYLRLKGLMFLKKFEGRNDFDGLLIKKCKSIHMFFVKFPIDAIF